MSMVDWDRIKSQLFDPENLSVREIAAMHGISDTAIRKWMKKQGIERDLSAEVKKRTQAKVLGIRPPAPVKVTAAMDILQTVEDQLAHEDEVVEAAAEQAAEALLTHQAMLTEAKQACMGMLRHIRAGVENAMGTAPVAASPAPAPDVASTSTTPPEAPASPLAYVKSLKDVAAVMVTVIELERKTYNIADVAPPEPPKKDGVDSPAIEKLKAAHARLVELAAGPARSASDAGPSPA
jgi:hypothetical protein